MMERLSACAGPDVKGLTRKHSYLPGKSSMAAHEV